MHASDREPTNFYNGVLVKVQYREDAASALGCRPLSAKALNLHAAQNNPPTTIALIPQTNDPNLSRETNAITFIRIQKEMEKIQRGVFTKKFAFFLTEKKEPHEVLFFSSNYAKKLK